MSARSVDESRIRKRIAEIDQHISLLLKERDELLFAERIIERLRVPDEELDAGSRQRITHDQTKSIGEETEPDSIEEALMKLESAHFSAQR